MEIMHILGHAHPAIVAEQNKSTLLVDGVKRLHEKLDAQHQTSQQSEQSALNSILEQFQENSAKLESVRADIGAEIFALETQLKSYLDHMHDDFAMSFRLNTQNQNEIIGRLNWLLGIGAALTIGVIGIWVKLLIHNT